MCRGTDQVAQASVMRPEMIQEHGSPQAQSIASPESVGLWQTHTYQCPSGMIAGAGQASCGTCYVSSSQTTSWVTTDGVNFVPVVFCSWPQDCGQLQQTGFCEQTSGYLPSDVWRLSRDAKGCRQVQQAFEEARSDEERVALASGLIGRVWAALKCPNANHVVQKCISTIRPVDAQFIIDELRDGAAGGVAQAARHRYGCRIIQRLLEHCAVDQLALMVNELSAEVVSLSSHSYGNYVVQHMLEFCTPDVVAHITSVLEMHIANIGANDYVGAVVGKGLSQGNNERRHFLAHTLLQQPEQLVALSCSRKGQLAVKEALKIVDEDTRIKACHELAIRADQLRACRYGRVIATFVTKMQEHSSDSVN